MERLVIRHDLPGTTPDPSLRLSWGRARSPFGEALVVLAGQAVCALEFPDAGEDREGHWRRVFAGLRWERDDGSAQRTVDAWISGCGTPQELWLVGTAFQAWVWRELVRLERGERCSYGELAARLGNARAVRAVASAVARNPVSLWVPCHRVVPSSGGTGNYRWGAARKAQLQAWEAGGADFRK